MPDTHILISPAIHPDQSRGNNYADDFDCITDENAPGPVPSASLRCRLSVADVQSSQILRRLVVF